MSLDELSVLLLTADGALAERLTAELTGGHGGPQVIAAATLERGRHILAMDRPTVIFFDEYVAGRGSLARVVRDLARQAPVVVGASPARQGELALLLSTAEVDCVATTGDFLPVIAALIDRRLRWEKHSVRCEETLAGDEAVDFGSLLRHELNNPLTGILGNAEMLLRHPEKLAEDAILRVETIADLAVRLRETIRRISNSWEARQQLGIRDLG